MSFCRNWCIIKILNSVSHFLTELKTYNNLLTAMVSAYVCVYVWVRKTPFICVYAKDGIWTVWVARFLHSCGCEEELRAGSLQKYTVWETNWALSISKNKRHVMSGKNTDLFSANCSKLLAALEQHPSQVFSETVYHPATQSRPWETGRFRSLHV